LPATAGTLDWVATVHVPGLNGQGVAWDRSVDDRVLWGILRSGSRVLRISIPAIDIPATGPVGVIHKLD